MEDHRLSRQLSSLLQHWSKVLKSYRLLGRESRMARQ